MSDICHQTSARTHPQCFFPSGWYVMEVTQSNAYDKNSNPALRDFLTVVLNEKFLLDQLLSAGWQEMSGISRHEGNSF